LRRSTWKYAEPLKRSDALIDAVLYVGAATMTAGCYITALATVCFGIASVLAGAPQWPHFWHGLF
jgi:hypothetical protein